MLFRRRNWSYFGRGFEYLEAIVVVYEELFERIMVLLTGTAMLSRYIY